MTIRHGFSWGRISLALENRNIRRYLLGQTVSQIGLWMQVTAELWLVLELTGSGLALGIHSTLRFGPLLALGVYGGLLSDRVDRLRLLLVTQSLHAAGAGLVLIAAVLPRPSIALIYAAALLKGCVNAVDNPLRRTFMRDLAPDKQLHSAIVLSSTMNNSMGVVGPAIAGVVISSLGVLWCFAVNIVSYGAVIVSLLLLDRGSLQRAPHAPAGRGQVRAGIRYVWRNVEVRNWLVSAAAVGIFAWNHNVTVSALASSELGGEASTYGYLLSTVAAGSLLGAMTTARVATRYRRGQALALGALGLGLAITSIAPDRITATLALLIVGAAGTTVLVTAQSGLQQSSDPVMAGRVMALYSIAVTGSRPIGGMASGLLIDLSGPRLALGAGACATGIAALWLAAQPPPDGMGRDSVGS